MKIEIDNCGTNNYYDEFLYVVRNYSKIHFNPNTKIKKLSFTGYSSLVTSLIIFVAFLVWFLISKETLQLIVTIFFALLIILSIGLLVLIKNNIKKISLVYEKTVFEMTKDYVSIENKKQSYKLNYDEMKAIIIGKYTILFIPKDGTKKFISGRIEYKNEIIDTLKKYKKENLIKQS